MVLPVGVGRQRAFEECTGILDALRGAILLTRRHRWARRHRDELDENYSVPGLGERVIEYLGQKQTGAEAVARLWTGLVVVEKQDEVGEAEVKARSSR